MKLLIRCVSNLEVSLEDAEIHIFDKKNPNTVYVVNPVAGYALIDSSEYGEAWQISMVANIKELIIKKDVSNEIFNYRG